MRLRPATLKDMFRAFGGIIKGYEKRMDKTSGKTLLAIDSGNSTMCGICFVPGTPWAEQARFIFPVKSGGFDREFWPNLLDLAELPRPDEVLAACLEGVEGQNVSGRRAFWKELFAETAGQGVELSRFITADPPERWGALRRLHGETGGDVCDSLCAKLLGLMARQERRDRSYKHGMCCLYLGNHFTGAYLVFRERVFGAYELPSENVTTEGLLADLEEFRLGWLPQERAAKSGGISCVDINLPAEAEGFKPLFVIGPKAKMLEGQARIVSSEGGGVFWGCFGLLHKYAFVHMP